MKWLLYTSVLCAKSRDSQLYLLIISLMRMVKAHHVPLLFYYLVISLNFQEVHSINHINQLSLSEGRRVIQARKGRAAESANTASVFGQPARELPHASPPDFIPNSISEIHMKYQKMLSILTLIIEAKSLNRKMFLTPQKRR